MRSCSLAMLTAIALTACTTSKVQSVAEAPRGVRPANLAQIRFEELPAAAGLVPNSIYSNKVAAFMIKSNKRSNFGTSVDQFIRWCDLNSGRRVSASVQAPPLEDRILVERTISAGGHAFDVTPLTGYWAETCVMEGRSYALYAFDSLNRAPGHDEGSGIAWFDDDAFRRIAQAEENSRRERDRKEQEARDAEQRRAVALKEWRKKFDQTVAELDRRPMPGVEKAAVAAEFLAEKVPVMTWEKKIDFRLAALFSEGVCTPRFKGNPDYMTTVTVNLPQLEINRLREISRISRVEDGRRDGRFGDIKITYRFKANDAILDFETLDDAQRSAQALRHLALRCGAKEDRRFGS